MLCHRFLMTSDMVNKKESYVCTQTDNTILIQYNLYNFYSARMHLIFKHDSKDIYDVSERILK